MFPAIAFSHMDNMGKRYYYSMIGNAQGFTAVVSLFQLCQWPSFSVDFLKEEKKEIQAKLK